MTAPSTDASLLLSCCLMATLVSSISQRKSKFTGHQLEFSTQLCWHFCRYLREHIIFDPISRQHFNRSIAFSCSLALRGGLDLLDPEIPEENRLLMVHDGSHAMLPYAVISGWNTSWLTEPLDQSRPTILLMLLSLSWNRDIEIFGQKHSTTPSGPRGSIMPSWETLVY